MSLQIIDNITDQNVLATITNASRAEINEVINSDFIATIELPASGDDMAADGTTPIWKLITDSNAIRATAPHDSNVIWLFDIVRVERIRAETGEIIVTAECEHVSYRLNDKNYEDATFEDQTPTQMMTEILSGIDAIQLGTVSPNVTDPKSFNFRDKTARAALIDIALAFVGELSYDGNEISLLARVGRASGAPALTTGINIGSLRDVDDTREAGGNGVSGQLRLAEIAYATGVADAASFKVRLGDTVNVVDADLEVDESLRIWVYRHDYLNPMLSDIDVGVRAGTTIDSLLHNREAENKTKQDIQDAQQDIEAIEDVIKDVESVADAGIYGIDIEYGVDANLVFVTWNGAKIVQMLERGDDQRYNMSVVESVDEKMVPFNMSTLTGTVLAFWLTYNVPQSQWVLAWGYPTDYEGLPASRLRLFDLERLEGGPEPDDNHDYRMVIHRVYQPGVIKILKDYLDELLDVHGIGIQQVDGETPAKVVFAERNIKEVTEGNVTVLRTIAEGDADISDVEGDYTIWLYDWDDTETAEYGAEALGVEPDGKPDAIRIMDVSVDSSDYVTPLRVWHTGDIDIGTATPSEPDHATELGVTDEGLPVTRSLDAEETPDDAEWTVGDTVAEGEHEGEPLGAELWVCADMVYDEDGGPNEDDFAIYKLMRKIVIGVNGGVYQTGEEKKVKFADTHEVILPVFEE